MFTGRHILIGAMLHLAAIALVGLVACGDGDSWMWWLCGGVNGVVGWGGARAWRNRPRRTGWRTAGGRGWRYGWRWRLAVRLAVEAGGTAGGGGWRYGWRSGLAVEAGGPAGGPGWRHRLANTSPGWRTDRRNRVEVQGRSSEWRWISVWTWVSPERCAEVERPGRAHNSFAVEDGDEAVSLGGVLSSGLNGAARGTHPGASPAEGLGPSNKGAPTGDRSKDIWGRREVPGAARRDQVVSFPRREVQSRAIDRGRRLGWHRSLNVRHHKSWSNEWELEEPRTQGSWSSVSAAHHCGPRHSM